MSNCARKTPHTLTSMAVVLLVVTLSACGGSTSPQTAVQKPAASGRSTQTRSISAGSAPASAGAPASASQPMDLCGDTEATRLIDSFFAARVSCTAGKGHSMRAFLGSEYLTSWDEGHAYVTFEHFKGTRYLSLGLTDPKTLGGSQVTIAGELCVFAEAGGLFCFPGGPRVIAAEILDPSQPSQGSHEQYEALMRAAITATGG